jgi:glycosyltransferase involved in cell wall biosynthesis
MLATADSKPYAVLLTPVLPALTGAGREMRAYNWLTDLAKDYQVVVVVIAGEVPLSDVVTQLATKVFFLPPQTSARLQLTKFSALICPPLCRLLPKVCFDWPHIAVDSAEFNQVQSYLAGKKVVLQLVFRLYLHEVGQLLAAKIKPLALELDSDDLESTSRLSLAKAACRLRMFRVLLLELSCYWQYRSLEASVFSGYQRVYLACREDIPANLAMPAYHRPNKVSLTAGKPVKHDQQAPLKLIFVGTLNYLPNVEAIERVILPLADLIQARSAGEVTLLIAGRNPAADLKRKLAAHPAIELYIDPPDLSALYQQAALALVPIKFGGGTKIKTIEAFAYQLPVISTAHGVRGLAAIAGLHYYAAETVDEFWQAICELRSQPVLARKLINSAYALYLATLTLSESC